MNAVTQDLNKLLNQAKIGVMRQQGQAFIITVLFNLKFKWTDAIPTAATEGVHLFFNPNFFTQHLDPDGRVFVLLHEAWHVAFMHGIRRGSRDPELWNIAADHVINNMLISAGHKMPAYEDGRPIGIADKKYRDNKQWSTERVYEDLLKREQAGESIRPQAGAGMQGDIMQPGQNPESKDQNKQPTQDQIKDAENKIRSILTKAATQARMQGEKHIGNVPGDVMLGIDELLNPKLPWYVILRNFVKEISKDDYSWRRPNKKYLPDFYLPSPYSENIGEIQVAIDTSGSVSQKDFEFFATEVHSIIEQMNPSAVRVFGFDTAVHTNEIVHSAKEFLQLGFKGRGGTDLTELFEVINTKHSKAALLIVFSDMWVTPAPVEDKPKHPVIWLSLDNPNAKANFGRIIHWDSTNEQEHHHFKGGQTPR